MYLHPTAEGQLLPLQWLPKVFVLGHPLGLLGHTVHAEAVIELLIKCTQLMLFEVLKRCYLSVKVHAFTHTYRLSKCSLKNLWTTYMGGSCNLLWVTISEVLVTYLVFLIYFYIKSFSYDSVSLISQVLALVIVVRPLFTIPFILISFELKSKNTFHFSCLEGLILFF